MFSQKNREKHSDLHLVGRKDAIDTNQLKLLRTPTLLIVGERDFSKRERVKLIAESLPEGRIYLVENAGRHVLSDNPKLFEEATLGFLLEDE